ncbi:glutamyl-tRNA reductase [Candidatus Acetothermia bacterium]|nr:glutamyl-tRNA reductase [Candidatus Acetothermia bacterium]MBI3642486.1 glutamyl-tRNA reductase [Candidatus Acetothermia bacterium]
MRPFAVGISHENQAPLSLLERVSFASSVLSSALERLQRECGLYEAVILSTCQRTEIYGVASETALAGIQDEISRFMSEFHGIPIEEIHSRLRCYESGEMAMHLFRVASALDAIALGENQVLGQVREAYGAALGANTTGKILSKLFQMAVNVGKQVRTETEIGKMPTSISSLAVDLAEQVLGGLDDKLALIIGSGEMSELAARLLRKRGIKRLYMINRTLSRAQELARAMSGEAVAWESLHEMLRKVDVVISSTAAPHHVIQTDQVKDVMATRKMPLFFVDIAMPRDIDPEVQAIVGVHLYNLDDLAAVVEKNRQKREREVPKALKIIEGEVSCFTTWLSSLESLPTVKALRDHAEDVRHQEVERTLQKLGSLPERDREAIEQMSRRIVTKLLHLPTVRLKENGHQDRSLEEATRKLFGLDGK